MKKTVLRGGFFFRCYGRFTECPDRGVKKPPGGGFVRYREDVKTSVKHLF